MMDSRRPSPTGVTLIDILDKVLDKGLVVAGDIRVSLANVELLTIQIRLLVCSIDKATEIGLDWWRRDRFLSSDAQERDEVTAALQARIEALEQQLGGTAEPARRPRQQPPGRRPPGSRR
ncbi:MAG TPA: gas vesicle protein [Dehalococcoidia bacterium]|nr:gas vesicle protein [Dehalococcoidia bacterium]